MKGIPDREEPEVELVVKSDLKAMLSATSQEANKRICYCLFGTGMMGKVPEGSFCPFCGWRRYESVLNRIADLKATIKILEEGDNDQ